MEGIIYGKNDRLTWSDKLSLVKTERTNVTGGVDFTEDRYKG